MTHIHATALHEVWEECIHASGRIWRDCVRANPDMDDSDYPFDKIVSEIYLLAYEQYTENKEDPTFPPEENFLADCIPAAEELMWWKYVGTI